MSGFGAAQKNSSFRFIKTILESRPKKNTIKGVYIIFSIFFAFFCITCFVNTIPFCLFVDHCNVKVHITTHPLSVFLTPSDLELPMIPHQPSVPREPTQLTVVHDSTSS